MKYVMLSLFMFVGCAPSHDWKVGDCFFAKADDSDNYLRKIVEVGKYSVLTKRNYGADGVVTYESLNKDFIPADCFNFFPKK